MEFGASIFFTDYSISPAELAIALEERGFDSLWAAEHSHIPVPRRTPPPGAGVRRGTGICECSAAHSESNPRSSSAVASSAGEIE